MSTYFEFYLGKKTSDGKIAMVAPFVFNPENDTFVRSSLMSRSKSFIDWEDFSEFMYPFSIEKMTDYDINFFTYKDLFNEENVKSNAYICTFAAMAQAGAKAGFRQGYIPLDNFSYVIRNGYCVDNEYDIEMISAEEYAETEDKFKYGKMAYIVRNATDRIARTLVDATHEIVGWDDDDYYFICRVC